MGLSNCIFYISIIAATALAILLFIQWIGQLRNEAAAMVIARIWGNSVSKLQAWLRHRSESLKLIADIVSAVLISRIFIFILGSVWALYFTNSHSMKFNDIWQKWDAFHYLFIAEHGYVTSPPDKAVLIAFYPLYPLLIRGSWYIFRDFTIAAYFVSNVSLMAGCFFLYKLVEEQVSRAAAAKSVLFLLVSPFSVFLGLVYTESLFLSLVLAFFYGLQKQWWLFAAIVGFFAALTKNQGLLLVIPYLMEATAILVQKKKNLEGRGLGLQSLKTLVPALLILAGFLVYVLINDMVAGNPFQFLVYQKNHWFNSFGFFAENIRNMLQQVSSYPDHGYRFTVMLLQPLVFMVALMSLFVAVAKNLRSSINVFSMAFLLVSFSPTWLLSGARYSTALFFIPMLLSIISTTTTRLILASGLSISLMSLFVIVYIEGAMV